MIRSSQVLEVEAHCHSCAWTASSANALAIAAIHARAHGHSVVVVQTIQTIYDA